MKELIGHTSPDTAYVVDDYPYGFRLRTSIRYWIETKAGHGQRVVSQTRNPKRAGMPWNQPKASTYSQIRLLYLDETTGYVENAGIGGYDDEEKLVAFAERFPRTFEDERNRKMLDLLIAHHRAYKHVRYTVTSQYSDGSAPATPRQSPEEQVAIIRKLTILELSKLRAEREAK